MRSTKKMRNLLHAGLSEKAIGKRLALGLRQSLGSDLQNLLAIDIDRRHVIAGDLAVLGGIRTSGFENVLVDKGLLGKCADELKRDASAKEPH